MEIFANIIRFTAGIQKHGTTYQERCTHKKNWTMNWAHTN